LPESPADFSTSATARWLHVVDNLRATVKTLSLRDDQDRKPSRREGVPPREDAAATGEQCTVTPQYRMMTVGVISGRVNGQPLQTTPAQ